MDYMALAGMIAQLAGSEAGRAASQMDRDTAMRLIQAAVDDMGKINVPKLKELFLQQQGKTGLAGIQDDPVYRAQQQAADAALGDVIDSGGLTLADKAAINAIRNKSMQAAAANRHAIENQMAARGTLDSGAQLAMQLQENSESANQLAAADEATAGRAEARAYEAIRERARNAAAGLDRDYRQKAEAARAQDAINAGNVAIQNTAARYNAGIPQQDYENQLRLAQAKAEPGYTLSDAYKGRADTTQRRYKAYGDAGAEAASVAGNAGRGSAAPPAYGNAAPDGPPSDPSEWAPYPGSSSSALTSAPTRNDSPIVGYDEFGRPIYRNANPQQLGQNF